MSNNSGAAIDKSVFIDAALYPVGGNGNYYVSKIVVTNTLVTLYISDGITPELAYSSFSVNAIPDSLRLVDIYGRPAGLLVSEAVRLTSLKALGAGIHEFSSSQTPFVASVCVPMPEIGIKGVLLDNGDLLTGDIWIVGDDGIVVSSQEVNTGTATYNTIRVDVVGDPLFRRRLCSAPVLFQTPQFIQNICFTTPELRGEQSSEYYDASRGADILMLTDTTGSMGGHIARVVEIMPAIFNTITATLPDSPIHWAVAGYRDFEDGTPYSTAGYRLYQGFTESKTLIMNALSQQHAGGGGDYPEQNLTSLKNVTADWLANGGRADVPKAIIWAGDVPGWEAGAKGYPYPTLQATIDALKLPDVAVFALNLYGPGIGIDSPGPAPSDGRQQASTLATATGGMVYNDISAAAADAVANAIVESVITTAFGTPGTPGVAAQGICCGPGDFGNISITVGSQDAPDTILRVRSAPEGLIIEAVGEKLEDIR